MTEIALDGNALAACPFCGGEAAVRSNSEKGRAWVSCDSCGAESGGYEDFEVAMGILCFKAAVEWNRRASPSQVAPANPAQVTDDDQAEKFRKAMLMAERVLGAIPASVSGKRLTAIDPVQVEISRAVSILWEARQDAIHAGWNPTAAIGAGGQAVAVKPLVWSEDRDDDGTEIHRTRGGEVNLPYAVYEDGFIKKPFGLSLNQLRIGSFDTVVEAKAAAQKDYERRILSALSQPHPADARVVEALAALRIDRDNEAERKARARHNKDTTMIAVHAYTEGVLAGHVKSFEAALSAKECR